MNAKEWLESRRAAPPVRLAARLEEAVADFGSATAMSRSETLAVAGAAILNQLTGPQAPEISRRKVAMDLLAADALVTYALEAAAEECESFAAATAKLIARLASLASAGKA